jgi:hypothetical protein
VTDSASDSSSLIVQVLPNPASHGGDYPLEESPLIPLRHLGHVGGVCQTIAGRWSVRSVSLGSVVLVFWHRSPTTLTMPRK